MSDDTDKADQEHTENGNDGGEKKRSLWSSVVLAAGITAAATLHATIAGNYAKQSELALETIKQRDATRAIYADKMTALGSRAAVLRFVKSTSDDPALTSWAETEYGRLGDAGVELLE